MICCRGSALEALSVLRIMMAKLKRTINETKTRQCQAPDEPFDFLGYTIGRRYSAKTGRPYIGVWPSDKKLRGLNQKLHEQTLLRFAGNDARQFAIPSFEEVGEGGHHEPTTRLCRLVAPLTLLLKNRPDVLVVADLRARRRRVLRGRLSGEQGGNREGNEQRGECACHGKLFGGGAGWRHERLL